MADEVHSDCTHQSARQILKQGKYESVAITEAVYPKYRVIGRHCHGLPNLGLVIRGDCTHEVGRAREEKCVPGELHYLPAGEKHSFKFHSDAHCMLLRVNKTVLEHLKDYTKLEFAAGKQTGEALHSLGQRLVWEFEQDDDVSPLAIEGLILEIFAQMIRFGNVAVGVLS